MERFALDMTLEIIEGSTHDLGDVTLWYWLRANTYHPAQPRPRLIALYRTPQQWSPPTISEPDIGSEHVEPVVAQLKALSWPGRKLDVASTVTPMAGTQELRLEVWLDGRRSRMMLRLLYGGFVGKDAEPLQQLIRTLVALGDLPSQEHWLRGTWRA